MELGEPYDAAKLKKTIDFLLDSDENDILVDLGDLQFLTEEALEAFAAIQKSVSEAGGRFAVIAPRRKARSILERSKLTSSLKILSNKEAVSTKTEPAKAEGKSAGAESEELFHSFTTDDEETSTRAKMDETDEEELLAPSFEDLHEEEIILGDFGEKDKESGESPTDEGETESDEPEFLKSPDETDEERGRFGESEEIEINPLSEDVRDEPVAEEPEEEVFYSTQKEGELPSEKEDPAFVDPDTVSFSEEAFEQPEAGRSDSEESPEGKPAEEESGEEERLGAKDRLRSPTPRRSSAGRSGRMGGRAWSSPKDVEKTGVVFVDDTVQGEAVSQKEIETSGQAFSESNLVDKSSSKGILIVMVLILAVIGGLVYLLKSSGTGDVFKKDSDKPAAVEETVPEEIPEAVTEDPEGEAEGEEAAADETQTDKTPAPQKTPPKKATPPSKPTRATPPPRPTSHSVTITSNPSSADVYVNGAQKGRTPLTVRLTRSSNRIVLQKEGYKEYIKHIQADGNQRLTAKLTPESGTPKAEPKKTVAPKSTPVKKPEPKEEPEPEPEEEPEPVVEEKKPEPKKEEPVKKLSGPLSKVFVASKPPGADILVDGRDQGAKTPSWLQLPPGTYMLKLEKGGQQASKEMVIKEGKNKSQYLILK